MRTEPSLVVIDITVSSLWFSTSVQSYNVNIWTSWVRSNNAVIFRFVGVYDTVGFDGTTFGATPCLLNTVTFLWLVRDILCYTAALSPATVSQHFSREAYSRLRRTGSDLRRSLTRVCVSSERLYPWSLSLSYLSILNKTQNCKHGSRKTANIPPLN